MNRTMSSTHALKDLKILGVGAGKKPLPQIEKKLTELGYKNVKLLGIYNTKESDQEFINLLKEKQWDVITLGAYVNGFDQAAHYHEKDISTDRAEILLWFNRILNLVHEMAPKTKIALLKSPQDFHEAVERIMVTGQN